MDLKNKNHQNYSDDFIKNFSIFTMYLQIYITLLLRLGVDVVFVIPM